MLYDTFAYLPQTDVMRRKHRYDEFIVAYLRVLAESGQLADIVRNSLNSHEQQQQQQHSLSTGLNGSCSSASSIVGVISAPSLFLQQPVVKKSRRNK